MRKGLVDGKIEPVAEFEVIWPFLIGHEVGAAGFNFHDGEPARPVERDYICTPPVFQAKLTDTDLAQSTKVSR